MRADPNAPEPRRRRAPTRKPWSRRSRRTVASFLDACERRDAAALRRVLRRDAALTIDSGGTIAITPHARGRGDVAAAILDLLDRLGEVRCEPGHVNGRPGIVLMSAGTVVGVINAVRRGRQAQELWIVANPEKLRHWNAM